MSLADDFNLIAEDKLAEFRGVKVSALRNERALGKGPPFTRHGRKVYYLRDGLAAYIAERTVVPSSTPTLIQGHKIRARRKHTT